MQLSLLLHLLQYKLYDIDDIYIIYIIYYIYNQEPAKLAPHVVVQSAQAG